MAKPGLEKDKDPKQALKSIAKALLLIVLAAGAFYLGLTVYTMRNSHKAVCLSIPSEEGLLVYNYCPPGKGPDSLDEPSDKSGLQPRVPDGKLDWVMVEFSSKVRFLDAAGKSSLLEDIFGAPPEKTVVEVTTGPEGKIARVSGVPGSFCVQGPVQQVETGQITVEKSKYTLEVPESFSGEEGDVVKLYGFDGKAIFAEILSKAGSIQVSANIEGARVFLDGVYKGKSPVSFKAPPGSREVMAKLDGYKATIVPVDVESQKESEILIELPLITGTIEVASTPPNAEIYINGELRGATDSKLLLPPGDYDIMVKLSGYYPRKARVRLIQDTEVPLGFELVKETSGISSGIGITPGGPIGGPSSGAQTGSGEIPGNRVTVVSFDSASRILEAVDAKGSLMSVEVPGKVSLETLPFGRTSWDRLLPGEEVSLTTGDSGVLERAIKVYSHGFSTRGTVFEKDGNQITLGDTWTKVTLNPDVLIHHRSRDVLSGALDTGDLVIVHGGSADDIRYVDVEDSLGEKSSFEGYIVKTQEGLRVFGDDKILWYTVPENIDVVDLVNQRKDKASAVPSGSRLRFYISPVGGIVWAEYVWKANVSIEGQIALLTGPVVSIMPSWEDVTVSQATTVFLDRTRRPYYDIRTGDSVLVAGPSPADARFIWIKHRVSFDTSVEGFMGAPSGRQGRVFHELKRPGLATPWIIDADLTFSYPKERRSLSFKEVRRGDKVRLWLGTGRQPEWGEIIERNEINIRGHYLGEDEGLLYFSGFSGFTPARDLTIVGLYGSKELQKGSLVHIGGQGQTVNYIEVESANEPVRWVDGTVLSIERNVMKVRVRPGFVTEYPVSKDLWYADWGSRIDGSIQDLHTGDEVSIGLDSDRQALFMERSYSPKFKAEGTVTSVSGRELTVSGNYGKLKVVIQQDAIVYRNNEITGYWAVQKGDRVKLAGPRAELIEIVVCSR